MEEFNKRTLPMEVDKKSIRRRVVLVTGSSIGLGLEIAKQLIVDDKYFLVLTSRKASSWRFLDAGILPRERIWLRDIDIENPRQIEEVIGEIEEKLGGVDVLINNAGISERSTVEDSSHADRLHQLSINYLAPFELIGRVLPDMRRRRSGQIINISSAAGFMAMPTMSAYAASKFALEAASEALWYEMKPWNIHVSLVVPGFINSLGHLNTTGTDASRLSEADTGEAYYEHYRGMNSLIKKTMNTAFATNSSIAKQIVKLLSRRTPPLRVHVTFDAKMLYWMRKLFPPRLYHFILYRSLPNITKWGTGKFKPKKALSQS